MDANFNPDKQHTLKQAVSISGTGLHTGIMVDMTLRPANPGYGFQFYPLFCDKLAELFIFLDQLLLLCGKPLLLF